MARTASVAVAGYYPTPPDLLPALAALVSPGASQHPDAWLDPCCGKGEALAGIARVLYPKVAKPDDYPGAAPRHIVALYAIEAEEGRFNDARGAFSGFAPTTWGGAEVHRGDALRAEIGTDAETPGVSGLYLNPPYDTDPRCKRLEERFLQKFTPALASEGVLLYVVPAHALPASVDTLATAYRDVTVLRFPDPHYGVFKQVVLIARKRATPLPVPHSATAALIRAAAESPLDLSVLGTTTRKWSLPPASGRAKPGVDLAIRPVSPDALAGVYVPWGVTSRGGSTREALNVHPVSASAGLERRFPAAMPLKPGHLAAALAAGVFNGECVVPNDPDSAAPPMLVKGVFRREWHTVEEKVTKDGAPAGEVQVEAPRLEVTVLSLTTGELHTLDAVPEPTGSTDPAEMTTGDLLVTYSRTLLAAMRTHCPPDYAPDNPAQHFPLMQSARPLYRAQEHACRGVVTQLGGPGLSAAARRGKYATLIGEVGCLRGDTMIHDPVDGSTRSVADRHRDGAPFHVWALGPHGPVVAAAMPPKRYPPAQMVRVVREDGASITVTPAHRFWDGRAWVRASDVADRLRASGRAPLASSEDTALSAHAGGGTRWSGTAPGSPGGCPPDPSSGGAPLPPATEGAPGRPPSPTGAPARSPLHSPPGASARTGAHSPPCRSSDPRSTQGCALPTAGRASAQSLPPPGSPLTPESDSSRAPPRPLQGCPPARRSPGLELVAPGSTSSVPSSHTSRDGVDSDLPGSHPAVQVHAIVAVEPLDTAPYYDFHVPVFNNYWAVGLWHHNSGKSGVFLVSARTAGATRVLILCPPHLLTGWEREAAAVWPEARVVVLDSVARIEALAADTGGPVVALLTRETAKLGHGWAGVSVCPACGAKDPRPAEALATKRSRCIATIRTPQTPAAARALDYARRLGGHAEFHGARALGFDRRVTRTARSAADAVLRDAALAVRAATDTEAREVAVSFLANAALSASDPVLRLDIAEALAPQSEFAAARLLATINPATPGWDAAAALITDTHWSEKLARTVNRAWRDDNRVPAWETFGVHRETGPDGRETITVSGLVVGSAKHLDDAVLAGTLGATTRPCGEVLYQATASPVGTSPFGGTPGAGPRRYPLATYIARRHPRLFDFLGLDEAHEYGGDGSAQERAAHRLTATRIPTVQLTGSLVNGYARHLFAGLWGLDVEFRAAFGKDSIGKFSQQYGYRRRFVDAEGKVKENDRGAVTDRVEGGVRDMGEAPGVQPLAVLRFVVRRAATLHKAELDTGVPELVTELVPVDPDPVALAAHKAMLAALVNQVKRDAFTPLSGALWGQLAEAPSHLDRCTADVGNTAEGAWVVQYPPHRGGGIVHRVEGLPAATVLPKEAWMVARCKAEVADGRPVIVLAWHTALFPRLHRLLRAAGLRVSVLDAGKVGAAKRQVWIEAQIAKGVDVLITNPVAIQTGLNCLTHFATTLWMQNPNCNAIVFRQANGRIDRIGQKQAPRCLIPVYRGSMQEALHTLLMRKVAVSQSTDGLDARSALQATGVGEITAVSTLSVGKLLFDLLDRGEA